MRSSKCVFRSSVNANALCSVLTVRSSSSSTVAPKVWPARHGMNAVKKCQSHTARVRV